MNIGDEGRTGDCQGELRGDMHPDTGPDDGDKDSGVNVFLRAPSCTALRPPAGGSSLPSLRPNA